MLSLKRFEVSLEGLVPMDMMLYFGHLIRLFKSLNLCSPPIRLVACGKKRLSTGDKHRRPRLQVCVQIETSGY